LSENKGKLFSEVYEEFLIYASKRHKKQGFDTFQRNFKNHILPYFKDRLVSTITKKDIIEWQNIIIDKNFCNGYNSTLYYAFSSFMKYCVSCSYVEENVVSQVDNFTRKTEEKKHDYYTLKEFRRFRRRVDEYVYKQFFNFMFFFGTRPSEALALRFCDIKGSYIHVCHSLQRRGKRELDTPKNQSSIRYLKLSFIAKIRIFCLRCFYIKHTGTCTDEYFIFGGPKPLSTSSIDRRIEKACKKAKMRTITQHQFRHSYATRMIHKGKSIDVVSQSLGHSRVSMTVDTYLHNKRGIPSIPHKRLFFFDTFQQIFKKISQYIITHFIV